MVLTKMLLLRFCVEIISIYSVAASYLNIEELNSLQYGVEISKEPVLFQEEKEAEKVCSYSLYIF